MNKEKILSPWRARNFTHYTVYYRVSIMNVIRAECIKSNNAGADNDFWQRMNDKDCLLIRDGYILCDQEQWDKYQMLV